MSGSYEITVPPSDDGAVKPWRKLLTGLDEDQRGGGACQGHWLDPGAVYELPSGALIVGCDRTDQGHRSRLWRITRDGGLSVERDSQFRRATSAFGDSIRATLRAALARYPAPLTTPLGW